MKSSKISKMALWLATVSILSTISIPMGAVPVTLQVFALFLMTAFLSPLEAFEVSIAYLVLGAIGLPVFAGAQGGIPILLGPTGGYLLGFPFAAFVSSIAWKKKASLKIVLLLTALLLIYIPGMAVLSTYVKSMLKAFEIGVIPFIWIDLIKISIVYLVILRLKGTVFSSKEVSKS